MSSEAAVRLTEVSKCYQSYRNPWQRLLQPFIKRHLYQEFWALRDVSLEVRRGETFGIVGRNGSGKSTLLQIIAGTLHASAGRVERQGRVSALLELGAGFNPEFTGYENARLNAAIMGIGQQQFEADLESIVAFSELGEFFHRPVRTYSSGMYVRLAFGVAIHMRPDVLIIDEALAVGDVGFQRKCFRRIEELQKQGVSILFVSHALETVVRHCDRAMLLEAGRMVEIGAPRQVVNLYLERMTGARERESAARPDQSPPLPSGASHTGGLSAVPVPDACCGRAAYNPSEFRWGDGRARIFDALLLESGRELAGPVTSGTRLRLAMAVEFLDAIVEPIYGLSVKTADGVLLYSTNTRDGGVRVAPRARGEIAAVEFEFDNLLANGDYFVSVGVAVDAPEGVVPLDRRYDVFQLTVTGAERAHGLVDMHAQAQERSPADLARETAGLTIRGTVAAAHGA
jgi:lipopolysaccharide transport system ATP-binding protein